MKIFDQGFDQGSKKFTEARFLDGGIFFFIT